MSNVKKNSKFVENELQYDIKKRKNDVRDFSNGDYSGADFEMYSLMYSNFENSVMTSINLIRSDAYGANFKNCYMEHMVANHALMTYACFVGSVLAHSMMTHVDLAYSKLQSADMRYVDLRYANLSYADVTGANFFGALLDGAILKGVNIKDAISFPYIPMTCPEEGSFTAYKKAKNRIVVLEIPEDAKRSSGTGRKCRCDKAFVKSIETFDGKKCKKEIRSDYNPNFIYKVGEMVNADNFNDDRFAECSCGIHFFMTRKEAIQYNA